VAFAERSGPENAHASPWVERLDEADHLAPSRSTSERKTEVRALSERPLSLESIKSVRIIDDPLGVSDEAPADVSEIRLKDGLLVRLQFRDGRLLSGMVRRDDGQWADGVVITAGAFPSPSDPAMAGERKCLFCYESEEQGVCACHEIPCGWILG
jgi:hypothetical protein